MPLTACVCFWTHVENLWKSAAPLWVGRLLRGADQSQLLVKQSRSAAALLQAPLDQWPSGQCVQGCGGGAVQLRMQPQLSRLAPPTEALQRSPLPDPALIFARNHSTVRGRRPCRFVFAGQFGGIWCWRISPNIIAIVRTCCGHCEGGQRPGAFIAGRRWQWKRRRAITSLPRRDREQAQVRRA